MKISFCSFNEQKEEVMNFLKANYPELELSITKCIYCCGECANKPIARINGELLVASNAKDLIDQILRFNKINNS